MGNQRVFVSFEDFSGGESGTRTGPNAPANSFTGLNVLSFIDGSVGPRSGLLDITPTGQSNGKISAMGLIHRDLTPDFFYVQGSNVYQATIGGARSTAYTGTIATPSTTSPPAIVSRNADLEHFITVPGDKTYLINHQSKTVTALASSPGGYSIAIYGVHVMVGTTGLTTDLPSRVAFSGSSSDETDVTSWDPLNYFNVPGDLGLKIRGLYTMRDYLLIARHDGELWRLSGVPGVNDVLRFVTGPQQGRAGFNWMRAVVTHDNQFWCVGTASTAPQVFNGGSLQSVEWLGTENTTSAIPPEVWASDLNETDVIPPQYGAVQPSPDSVAFVGTNKGLIRRHGGWSKHAFGQTVTGFVARRTNGAVILSDGGAAGAAPKFWWWNTGDDRPPIKGKGVLNRDSIGDASDTAPDCHFTTPEWWDKQGRRVHVKRVVVSFTEYDTALFAPGDPDNTALFNNFGVSVTALDPYGANASATSAVQTYNADPRPSTQPGIRRRKEFGFGDQGLGQGFKINITDLRGIKIHGIQVAVDITEDLA